MRDSAVASSIAGSPAHKPVHTATETNILHDLHSALLTLQDDYFALWLGKWTEAIDWTGAVMGTYLSATLSSLSRSIEYTMPGSFDGSRKLDVEAQMVENEINKYFSQLISYYFGEDHFAIRMQAFDDMLWVVLGWLEGIQFIEGHSGSHYTSEEPARGERASAEGEEWHARQFIPAFAHRARVFYELAEQGWDWRLCGGGMTWNPSLLPYKNAITNQLFISASISMYFHFPGDENCSPFLSQFDERVEGLSDRLNDCGDHTHGRYDSHFLTNAKNGYDWLRNSGMLNDQGLYTDGFHISGYRQNHSKTTCDERNDMVYTYNQGVILTGLRGLWEATGDMSYLEDGHELVRNVISATGWNLMHPQDEKLDIDEVKQELLEDWMGLGSGGILTELCDPSGQCNQNGQTFKGIFFHHLTTFCSPLPTRPVHIGKTHAATKVTAGLHRRSCDEYTGWVIHNAQAALRTRDKQGRFGAWWGVPNAQVDQIAPLKLELHEHMLDYRNGVDRLEEVYNEVEMPQEEHHVSMQDTKMSTNSDLNDRGRGRTVETQGSGLAVVRAMWEFVRLAESSAMDEST